MSISGCMHKQDQTSQKIPGQWQSTDKKLINKNSLKRSTEMGMYAISLDM